MYKAFHVFSQDIKMRILQVVNLQFLKKHEKQF